MSPDREPLVIAHRGASADHPENTADAFTGAAEQGADWVELDVRLTADGCLIVHHDPWYHDQRSVFHTPGAARPEGVLDLVEALDACRRAGGQRARPLGVNVEIKNSPGDLGDDVPHGPAVADAVVDLLALRAAGGVDEEILVSSFDPGTVGRVRALGGPPTAQLVYDLSARPAAVEEAAGEGHVALHPWDPFVDAALVGRAHDHGLAVNTWTVDDVQRIRWLASMGVDGIVTNVPAAARRALRDAC